MNIKNFFQKTWTMGLLLFSILAFNKGKKTIEIKPSSTEDVTKEGTNKKESEE